MEEKKENKIKIKIKNLWQNFLDKSLKNKIIFCIGLALIIGAIIALIIVLPKYLAKEDYNDDYTKKKSQDETVYWYDLCNVDFDALQETNSEVVGWIYFENDDSEAISYPILQSDDNDKYLHTNAEGQEAKAGSIFLDYRNNSDLNDAHCLIYGHNMRNLSMFGRLKYYRTQEGYVDSHLMFQIITPTYKYRYQIFSLETVSETSEEYTNYKTANSSFNKLVDTMKQNSDSQITVDESADWSHVVTLSTCTVDEHSRYVVHGVRIDTFDGKTTLE